MLRVSVPINLDCEHLALSFWMVGVGEMTNLYTIKLTGVLARLYGFCTG